MPTYDKDTGEIIVGIDEMWQGLDIILSTPRGSRVMRRKFGSVMPDYVDRGVSPMTLIDWYAGIAEAIRTEPRFALIRCPLSKESDLAAGNPVFEISGIWYPRGHLGDFSEAVTINARPTNVSASAI